MAGERYNATVDLLERDASPSRAARPYLLTDAGPLTYGEVIRRSRELGAGLLALGLQRGERVLVLAQDCAELVCTFWGAIRAGLVIVPISPLMSARDFSFIVDDSGARAVVFDPSVEAIVAANDVTAIHAISIGESAVTGARRWAEVAAAELPAAETTADDIALWLYTSGTTGKPKAALHRHRSLGALPDGWSRQILQLGANDVILSVSRMFFCYGLTAAVVLPAAAGASVVVANIPAIPLVVQGLIEKRMPTLLFASASFFAGYTKLKKAKPGALRLALSAGESLSSEVFASFRERFSIPLIDGFGCTETMHVTSNRPDDAVAGSAGRAIAGYELQVRDPAGKLLPDDTSGELWVRGPTLFAGYWNRPELTEKVLVDGWLRTGDLAHLVDGRLFHEGRLDDLMKLGGIWVAPTEIEDVLRGHEDVEDAGVVISDRGDGAPVLKAFIRSARSDPDLFRELSDVCRDNLASFKVPKLFETIAELPRTATGKLMRFELRALLAKPEL